MPNSPSWLVDRPLIFTGSWDSTPVYFHRRGGASLENEINYERQYQTSTVEAMAALGVSLAVIDFFKCFGLAAEIECANNARGFIAECKRRGIRVGMYVGSTIGYEQFLLERPDAADWLVRGGDGSFLYYVSPGEDQSFRARMYFMHPGYREYIQHVLEVAITDFGADEIHFDSASVMAAPEIFYHPMAVEDFRDYLHEHDPAELKERLGFSDVSAVLPPRFAPADTLLINDPLMQYWADFRSRQLVAYFSGMRSYIRQLNPEVVVSVNTVACIYAFNSEWNGVNHALLIPETDILWNEEPNAAGVTAEGTLTSKIRSYKLVSKMHRRMMTYAGTPLELAESMAYNRETIGMVGDHLHTLAYPEESRRYVDFFRKQFQYYRGAEPAADVAVLYSTATMTYNGERPYTSSLLFHQALIQGRIPFDIICDQHLDDLPRYRVLVLPDQECLSDEQIATITRVVRAGGGLVATEHTSLYTENRRRRVGFALVELLGNLPAPKFTLGLEDPILDIPVVQKEAGEGRAVYIPEVVPPTTPNRAEHYPLPTNWQALLDMVRWAAGAAPLSLEVRGPVTLAAQMNTQNGGSRYVIHLLNYAGAAAPAADIGIQFRVPDGTRVRTVRFLSPDASAEQSLKFAVAGEILAADVPEIPIYGIVVVTLDSAGGSVS
jgi:hypothetical protein